MWKPTQSPLPPWLPAELIGKLGSASPDELIEAVGNGYLLLVRLDSFNRDLAMGLSESRSARPSWSREEKATLGFQIVPEDVTAASFEHNAARASGPRIYQPSAPQPFPRELLQAECYAVPLPRTSKPVVSVGRAPTHDIVLRHPSVSKLHAFIRSNPELSVEDAGSLNQTLVNGKRVEQSQLLNDGDVIKFGAVQALVCSPVSLWNAVHGVLSK